MQWKKRREFLRQGLRLENLESRSLLAGLIGESPWQNPLDANDLDCDGALSPSDALVAINAINSGASGEFSGHFAPPQLKGEFENAAEAFLDADGDGVLSPSDPLTVINAINSNVGLGLGHDAPTVTDLGDTIADAHDLTTDAVNGFVRVRGVISGPDDVDYFKVDATKTRLHVMLFSRGSEGLTVAVVDAADQPISDDAEASIEAGSHRPAKLNLEVEAGTTYYIKVSGEGGPYALAVLNFDELTFAPQPDSPPGQDIHGDTPEDATELKLADGRAAVISNIDGKVGDADEDVFTLTAVEGKLILTAQAEFDLLIEIRDSAGVLKTLTVSDRQATAINVAAGTYTVTVAAANAGDTGLYRLHIVNVSGLGSGEHLPPEHPGQIAIETVFAHLDANGDGFLTQEDELVEVRARLARIADDMFDQWDTNNDDKLSLEEVTAGLSTLPPLLPNLPHREGPGPLRRVFGLRLDPR